MQAVVFGRAGRAEDVLQVRDIPPPVPAAGQVLIEVAARPIHPADFMFIAGRYRVAPVYPQTAGFDGVGRVVACAPGVDDSLRGKRVAFRHPGAWAELAVAPASHVYPVPDGIPDEVACQFPLNPLTAWGLLAECQLPPGARILATAGRSVLARTLAALARRRRLELVLLVREGTEQVAIDAADGRILGRGAAVSDALHDVLERGRFHAVLDAVGGAATASLIEAIEPRGRLISYGVLDDSDITLRASTLLAKNLTWSGFGINAWLAGATPQQLADARTELWTLLGEHPELVPVIARFPLGEVDAAVLRVRGDKSPGKVILV